MEAGRFCLFRVLTPDEGWRCRVSLLLRSGLTARTDAERESLMIAIRVPRTKTVMMMAPNIGIRIRTIKIRGGGYGFVAAVSRRAIDQRSPTGGNRQEGVEAGETHLMIPRHPPSLGVPRAAVPEGEEDASRMRRAPAAEREGRGGIQGPQAEAAQVAATAGDVVRSATPVLGRPLNYVSKMR